MKKKSIIALLLACSFAFGAATFTGCNIIGGDDGKDNTTQTPDDDTDGDKKDPVQNPDGSDDKDPDKEPDKNPDGDKDDDKGDSTVVKVRSITMDPSAKEIVAGNQFKINVGVLPATAKDKTVTWSSSDSAVAAVDQNGNVTAKTAGTANITATANDGSGVKGICNVTVKPSVTPATEYTVKFYSDGKLVETKTVREGETVSAPTSLEKDGFYISGWGTSSASGANFDFTKGVTSNLNLYAKWTELADEITYTYAGNECAAFEWGDSNPAEAKVEYKLSTASSYTRVDSQLIRAAATADVARADVVGLKGGCNYDFKITTSTGAPLTVNNVTIHAYDRSGYAHFGKSDGVGAYNNDGTPKDNAQIIYLTEENKNNIDGRNTSIAQYLKNSANNSDPIIIRVVGTVGSATWNSKKYTGYSKTNPLSAADFVRLTPGNGTLTLTSSGKAEYTQQQLIDGGFNTLNKNPAAYGGATCEPINGLNSKIMSKADSELGYVYDSIWNDCQVQNVRNVTIEGIGEDAEIFQWGFTFKNSSSVEVRNLHFDDYTEDGCSFEASETGATTLSGFNSGNVWLHHNTFDEGMNYWDVCDEQDKGDGDGSTDFKGIKNITIAYNHYIETHKTGLIGGDDKHATANVTFHHNYYEGCNQRMPLGRQANMHMYNNYYAASTLYSISLRAGAYAFIENCVFTEDASNHYPVELISGSYGKGAAKIVNCDITSSKIQNGSGNDYLYVGNDRNATVDMTYQRFAKNFDMDATKFYYKDGKSDVTQMLTAAETKTIVPKLAGVQKRNGDVTLGGSGSTGGDSGDNTGGSTGGNTGGDNTGGETGDTTQTKTEIVISDFSAANGKETHTLAPSSSTLKYFDSTQIYLYTTDTQKLLTCTNTYVKLQSANKIKFTTTGQLPAGAKMVLTMDSTNQATAVKVNDNSVNIVNGKVTFDLAGGTTYILGRASGETRIASISIIIPA